jgi:hypothetical protein
MVATDRLGRMPLPQRVQLTAASVHDLTALRQQLPAFKGGSLVADKAYADSTLKEQLTDEQAVDLHTPVKKAKGAKRLDAADKLYSTYVSRMRQPAESLFRWLIGQVDLQNGSRVRSEKGAILHCMGRLAAALYMLVFDS